MFIRKHYSRRSVDRDRLSEDYDREKTVAITSDSLLITKMTPNSSPFVHPNGDVDVLNPLDERISQREYISMTPSFQKPVPCRILFFSNTIHTPFTCNRANRQPMGFLVNDTSPQNLSSHSPDHPNNWYRKWISCRSVCGSLHQFSPHVNRSQAWLHPR